MELIHLKILLALQRRGSLIAAADELCLTQSALSHQIKNLEKKLGVVLWRKHGRKLVLTQAGSYLCDIAESVLTTVDAAERHLRLLSEGKTGNLIIGVDCHACYEWFNTFLFQYLQAWPCLEIEVTSKYRFNALEAISHYQLDALMTADPGDIAGIRFQPLFDFELKLLVAKSHPLAVKESVVPKHLSEETVLTYPVDEQRLDMFQKVLVPNSISPGMHKTVEETAIMLQMVAAGRGVCLLPEWVVGEGMHSQEQLVALPVTGIDLKKTMYLATREEDSELEYIRWLVDFVHKKYLRKARNTD